MDKIKIPPRVEDLIGKTIGKYTVLAYRGLNDAPTKIHVWLCRCECGRENVMSRSRLKSNKIGCGSCLNRVKDEGDYLLVDVSTEKFPNTFTKVDKNFEYLFKSIRWYVYRRGNGGDLYVRTNSDLYGSDSLHRVVNATPKGLHTDHISGNTLDNRSVNLRSVTTQQNQQNCAVGKNNTSKVVGVGLTPKGRWRAYIFVDYKQIHLGHYDNFEDAVSARKEAEKLYGFHENHGRESIITD